jgi:hypothetical protein
MIIAVDILENNKNQVIFLEDNNSSDNEIINSVQSKRPKSFIFGFTKYDSIFDYFQSIDKQMMLQYN